MIANVKDISTIDNNDKIKFFVNVRIRHETRVNVNPNIKTLNEPNLSVSLDENIVDKLIIEIIV